jgi:MOSC domain-containing protein YiiM
VTGTLEAIWLKRAHRGVMDAVRQATLVEGRGLEGNVDRSRRRQVTILAREAWSAALADLGADVDPSARRANLLISGLTLAATRGRVLRVGDARLLVGGETRPCERMDEAHAGLQAALSPDWRAGVFAEVLHGALVRVGDPVEWDR